MRLRGFRDIKTHGSLAREGRLISAAKNLHRAGNRVPKEGETFSDNWSSEQHIYDKKKSDRPHTTGMAFMPPEFLLEKVRLYQREVIQDFLQEMHQAIAEGIPVAMQELDRLTKRLAELETG